MRTGQPGENEPPNRQELTSKTTIIVNEAAITGKCVTVKVNGFLGNPNAATSMLRGLFFTAS